MTLATILLTGSTGFLGKVVLEELLRRKQELSIDKIILLIRARTPSQARRRFETEIKTSHCLSHLPKEWERCVSIIAGDITRSDVGLDETSLERVFSTTTQIVHCAASIEFNLPLRDAALANISGSLQVLDLAKRCRKKPSLLVVSTAYVTPYPTDGGSIGEELSPLPRPAIDLYTEILEDRIGTETVLAETRHPNTYTLTKCIAEHLLIQQANEVPISLIRPSIISASQHYPFPGWIDSQAAFAGFVAMCGLGHMQVVAAKPSVRLDVVPCDAVAHRIIKTSLGSYRHSNGAPIIQHIVNGQSRSFSIDECRSRIDRFFHRHRIGGSPRIRYVGPSGPLFTLYDWLHHTIPGTVAHWWYSLTKRKARGNAIKRRLERLRELNKAFRYFTHHIFDFDVSEPLRLSLNPETYLDTICAGVHRYLLRQDPAEIPIAGREYGGNAAAINSGGAKGERCLRLLSWFLRWILHKSSNLVTFDLVALEKVLANISSDERPILFTSRQSRLDSYILSLLCLTRPDLHLHNPRVIESSDNPSTIAIWGARILGTHLLPKNWKRQDRKLVRGIADIIATRHTLILPLDLRPSPVRVPKLLRTGLVDGLQETGRRFVLIPVTVNYDRVPEERGFLRELSGGESPSLWDIVPWIKQVMTGKGQLGRIHIRFGEPTGLDLDSTAKDVERLILQRLHKTYATSTFHLRSFLLATAPPQVDLGWLCDKLSERNATVIRSRMRKTAPETVESSFRALWRYHFISDAIAIEGNNPFLGALSVYASDSKNTESIDPRFAHLTSALIEPWIRQCVAAAHQIGRPSQLLRCTNPRDLLTIVPGIDLFSAEAVFSALEKSHIIISDDEKYRWGPRAKEIDEFLNKCGRTEISERARIA